LHRHLRFPRFSALFALCALLVGAQPAVAAKYAGEFLRLGMGARNWALGGAGVADISDATAVYWNPANLSHLHQRDVMLMHAETFGSLLNYDAISFGLPSTRSDKRLAVGFAISRLGGGDIHRTQLANDSLPASDTNRVSVIETVGHSDWALYAGVGKAIGEKLEAGASLKLIYRDLVDVSAVGLGLDLGATYKPHRWWSGALVVYDITTTLLSYDNGEKESVYPRASLGLAYAPEWQKVRLTLLADGVMEFEGRRAAAQFYQGSISLDVRWGVEVLYRKRLALRGGMDAENPTLGIGISFKGFSVDGAWRGHDTVDDSYRFSISHSW
jgi:hypothetical protein